MSHKGRTVEEYVSSFPAPVQDILHDLRRTIRTALPGMEETIRYDMPAVMLNGAYVVHYAAWKHHHHAPSPARAHPARPAGPPRHRPREGTRA